MPRSQEPDADPAYVRRLCHDVLQRSPRPIEVRTSVGMPIGRVAGLFLRRLEAMQQWVEEELYYYLLTDRFRPRTRSIEELPVRLRDGDTDVRAASAEILLSTGFSLRNPGNDTFVSVVLEQGLGMSVQERRNVATLEAGRKLYDGQPTRFLGQQGRNQSDVVRIVIEHAGFVRHLLDRQRHRLLGSGLDTMARAQADAVVARVHDDPRTFFDVIAEWLTSADYLARVAVRKPRTDRQFVRSLYMDVLEREPDYEEIRNVRNALQSMADATPLRAVMVKLVLASRDAKLPSPQPDDHDAFVRDCFRRYLGRQPTQQELTEFSATLGEPGTDPALLIRALLSSPEYGYC